MDLTTMFNLLSVLTALGVLVCLVVVRRLSKVVASPAWTVKTWAFVFFLLAQIGGLINIYLFDGGLSWLGIANTGLRLLAIALLAHSYHMLDVAFKGIVKKFRLKIPMEPPKT